MTQVLFFIGCLVAAGLIVFSGHSKQRRERFDAHREYLNRRKVSRG